MQTNSKGNPPAARHRPWPVERAVRVAGCTVSPRSRWSDSDCGLSKSPSVIPTAGASTSTVHAGSPRDLLARILSERILSTSYATVRRNEPAWLTCQRLGRKARLVPPGLAASQTLRRAANAAATSLPFARPFVARITLPRRNCATFSSPARVALPLLRVGRDHVVDHRVQSRGVHLLIAQARSDPGRSPPWVMSSASTSLDWSPRADRTTPS